MTYRTALFPALACTFTLAAAPAGAGAVSDAATAPGTVRPSSGEIGELRELLTAHGIPPARQLAGEITREITGSNREAAMTALFRPPAMQPPGTAPAHVAVAEAGGSASAGPARASAPDRTTSPGLDVLRKALRFLNLRN